jgi:hypothetical protein
VLDNIEFDDFLFQQPQAPARASLGRIGTRQGDQLGFPFTVKDRRHGRRCALLSAQHRLKAFFHQLPAHPVDHRCAGLQRLDNPAVAPSLTGLGDIGLEQDPRL